VIRASRQTRSDSQWTLYPHQENKKQYRLTQKGDKPECNEEAESKRKKIRDKIEEGKR